MTTPTDTPNVVLHIDRLVLHGFEHVDRARLGRAVEAELTRLVAERGIAPALAADARHPRIDGGRIDAASDTPTPRLATLIARSVHGGLSS
ncbi:MAG: hypothetical protein ABJF88_07480 [Rhodothermales bacterium]